MQGFIHLRPPKTSLIHKLLLLIKPVTYLEGRSYLEGPASFFHLSLPHLGANFQSHLGTSQGAYKPTVVESSRKPKKWVSGMRHPQRGNTELAIDLYVGEPGVICPSLWTAA